MGNWLVIMKRNRFVASVVQAMVIFCCLACSEDVVLDARGYGSDLVYLFVEVSGPEHRSAIWSRDRQLMINALDLEAGAYDVVLIGIDAAGVVLFERTQKIEVESGANIIVDLGAS